MRRLEVFGIKIEGEIQPTLSLPSLIVEGCKREGYGIMDGDVVVVAGKAVSKDEGRVVRLSDVKPSPMAKRIARRYMKPPELVELYLRVGKILLVIPTSKIVGLFPELAARIKDESELYGVLSNDPYLFMVSIRGRVFCEGGIDMTNCPQGMCILLPEDPDASARRIRAGIREKTGREVAVVITDTEIKLDKFGTQDIALGSSGIKPVNTKFWLEDADDGYMGLGGTDDVTDLIAATANLCWGQSRGVPVVIIRGLSYEPSDDGVWGTIYSASRVGRALWTLIW
ncbi:MAG: coenzyme F420-0:L-glutamate ligase, partial [Candidatus Caldarchaeum sp.]